MQKEAVALLTAGNRKAMKVHALYW